MHKYFTTFAKLIEFTDFSYFAKFRGICKVESEINFLLQILCITFEKLSSILRSMLFFECVNVKHKLGKNFLLVDLQTLLL